MHRRIAMSMNVRKIDEEAAGESRVVEFAPHRPTVGEWLREARESYGLKLGDVSSTLRIRQTYLEALEADRFEDLPGSTYAIGFLRAYSEYLGLDGIAVVQRFREQAGEDHAEEELSFPVPKSDNRVPRGAILLMSLALAVVAYGAWYVMQDEESSVLTEAAAPPPVETEPAAPATRAVAQGPSAPAPSSIAAQAKQEDEAAPEADATVAVEAAAPASQTAQPAAPANEPARPEAETAAAATAPEAPASEPAPAAQVAAAPEPPATEPGEATATAATAPAAPETPTTETAAEQPGVPVEPVPKPAAPATAAAEPQSAAAPETTQTASAPPAPPAAPAAIEPGEIVIRAQVDSWVEVRDADNAPLVSRLLRAGDEYEIPAGQGLKLVTGNAGALSVFVDGNEVPPLAPPGAVRRYIALDAERLRQGTALIE